MLSSLLEVSARAKALVNTKTKPAGFDLVRATSLEANAYHYLDPYPYFHFQDWKKEDRGPLPRCMPFTKGMVKKGARWLFGRPVNINLTDKSALQTLLTNTWRDNKMPARMVAAAETGGVQGTIVLKYAYNELRGPVYSILSPIDNCRLYYDPHDIDTLLMLRIQYPYLDEAENQWYWYREEWTADEEIHYKPIVAKPKTAYLGTYQYGTIYVVADGEADPDKYTKWVVSDRKANPFQMIPAHVIKNIETGTQWGAGDLWGLYRIIDRVNLSYHLQDKSNQFDGDVTLAYIDLKPSPDTLDRPVAPGTAQSLVTDTAIEGADTRQGKVQMLEPSGRIRPYMESYAKDLRQMISNAVGYVEINQGEVTNKGNLTQAVLSQLYAPLIEATNEKRKTYGDEGIAIFLKKVVNGLANAKVKGFEALGPEEIISLTWSDYFPLSEDEKHTRVERLVMEEQNNYINHEEATRIIMVAEEIDDVEGMVDKMKNLKVSPAETNQPERKPAAANLKNKAKT